MDTKNELQELFNEYLQTLDDDYPEDSYVTERWMANYVWGGFMAWLENRNNSERG